MRVFSIAPNKMARYEIHYYCITNDFCSHLQCAK